MDSFLVFVPSVAQPHHNPLAPWSALPNLPALTPPVHEGDCPYYPDTRSSAWPAYWVAFSSRGEKRNLQLATECWRFLLLIAHSLHLPRCPEVGPPCWRLILRAQMQIALYMEKNGDGHAMGLDRW